MAKIDLKNIKKCYLLYGEDSFSRRAIEDKIKKKVVDEVSEMMNVSVFDDVKTNAGQVIEAAETLPFMSEKRFVLVRDCGFFSEGKKAESDLLAVYMKNLPDTACIVFSEEKADKRLKLYKAVDKNGVIEEYKNMNDNDLADLIGRKFAKNGIKVTKPLCIYMVRTTGADAELLKRESDKLLAYLGDKKEITTEDIDAICSKTSENKVFDLIDAMIEGKTEHALEIYRNLLLLNESPFMILSLISRQLRIILKCKSLSESGMSPNDIAKNVGVPTFVANGALKQGKSFSYDNIKSALNECIEMDYKMKSGIIDQVTGVEMIIVGKKI